MKYLEAEWTKYRDHVPQQMGEDTAFEKAQILAVRSVFMTGAAALHSLIMRNLEPGSGPPSKNDLKMMADIDAELVEFGREGFEDERSK